MLLCTLHIVMRLPRSIAILAVLAPLISAIADISNVMQGHEYCTDDPWTYGLSVLLLNDDSQAPFHPTPAGQAAIADIVKQSIPSRAHGT